MRGNSYLGVMRRSPRYRVLIEKMRRILRSDTKTSDRAPCSGHNIITDNSGGCDTPTDMGKVASTLLAKHVRTLEVLHSLQMDNAKLRRESQLKLSEEDIGRRVAKAVAEAIEGPNDLSTELQSQLERLRARVSELEGELTAAKEASARIRAHSTSQMEGARAENQKIQKKCEDLQFEASRLVKDTSSREELESQLQQVSATLSLAQGRAKDLARTLAERELASRTLELHLKQRDEKMLAMKATRAGLESSLDEHRARAGALELESQELRHCLKMAQQEGKTLNRRLKETLRDMDSMRKKATDRTTQEEAMKTEMKEEKDRVKTAEGKLAEEQRRSQTLLEEWNKRLHEEDRKYGEALARHSIERRELLAKVDALSREVSELKAQLNNNRSQFSKYVEAKTENNRLKEKLDGLKDVMVDSRPPRQSQSLGSASISAVLGELGTSKHVSVDRLRHSISVARGHGNSNGGSVTSISTNSNRRGHRVSSIDCAQHHLFIDNHNHNNHRQRDRQSGAVFGREACSRKTPADYTPTLERGLILNQ